MNRLPIDVQKSFRYSRVRVRTLRALGSGPLYPTDLARAARVDLKTLQWAMYGHPPRYRRERALVILGLVRFVDDVNGAYYELTMAGRRVLAAMGEVDGAGTMAPVVAAATGAIVPAPAASAALALAPAGAEE